jgi:parvulin-like peptidyl-prolyl isomerase
MSATTKGLIAAVVAIAFAAGLIVWQVKASRAKHVNLTPQDMALLAKDQDPRMQMQLASSDEARKEFAKNIREVLALSEEARAAGIADQPAVKRQLALMRSLIIANAYLKKKQQEAPGVSPLSSIPQAEVDAFLKEPGVDEKFKQFIEDAQGLGLIPAGQQIPEAQLAQIKTQWAQVFVAERQAIKAGLDKDKGVELQLMLQEARVLVNEYGEKQLAPKIKASDQEIDEYIAKHPEFDPSKAKAKAEDILKRARAGEDFAALAKEFSTDPGSKGEGGELGWFGHGKMVKPFEDAAFSLQPGQISDVVESDFGFHIIQVEERATKNGDDGKPEEQVRARHILIAKGPTEQPNQFGPPQAPREQARAAVEKEKREKVIEEIVKRTRVSVADNFEVAKPEMPKQSQGMPPGGAPPPGMEEDVAPEPPPAPAPKGQPDSDATPKTGAQPKSGGNAGKPSPKR